MTDFTNWANLGTMTGAVAAVLLIVQYIKAPLDKVWKIPTRALVYVLALIILTVANMAADGWALDLPGAVLIAINAAIVALAAMGAYEATFRRSDEAARLPVDEQAGEDV